MPLSMILPGEEGVIDRISGKDDTKRFLNRLGFVEGNAVTVISEAAGNIIVGVLDARIAIGRKMANKIFVEKK
ncbi:MAG: ferrous iron transport protein A [Eubacterium sp.]|nr:ferrous iron transport protein A [Eubacterium sp.]